MGGKRWQVWVRTRWSRWGVGRLLLYALVGIWAIQANPFGLSSASDKALSDELSRVRAYLSPVAQAPITVVEIDYDSVRSLYSGGWMGADDWPLGYEDHMRVIRDIAIPKGVPAPATVLYDVFFERPHAMLGDMKAFGRNLARLTGAPAVPPIHLAGGGESIPMSTASYRTLQQPSLAVVEWHSDGGVYPLHSKLRPPALTASPVPEDAPLAATMMYLDLCRKQGSACEWATEPTAPPLALQWEVLDKPQCSMANLAAGWERAVTRVKRVLWRMLGLSPEVDRVEAGCLPYHRIRLADFYEDPSRLVPPNSSGPYAVLVGVAMQSLGDYHPSPVYGQIAGVNVHAMALENLLRLGDGYIQERDVRKLSMAVWVAVLLAFWIQRQRRRAKKTRELPSGSSPPSTARTLTWPRLFRRWLSHRAKSIAVFAAIVLFMYYALYEMADIAPEGWLSLIALVPLLMEVVLGTENRLDMEKEKTT